MARRVLALRLVPTEVFGRLLVELRQTHPDTSIVAVAASDERAGADEVIDWRHARPRSLAAELRRRRFDLAVVAHGRDQYATRAYWKAVLLAAIARARETVLCEDGLLARRHGVGLGAARAVLQMLQELYAGGMALMVLLPLMLLAGAADLTEALAARAAGPAVGQTKDSPDDSF